MYYEVKMAKRLSKNENKFNQDIVTCNDRNNMEWSVKIIKGWGVEVA